MEGMIEALVGSKAGETKMVPVTFPIRPSGPGAALSGKEALFQVEVTINQPHWTLSNLNYYSMLALV